VSSHEKEQTVVLRRPQSSRAEPKSHASLIVLQGSELGRDFRLRGNLMIVGRSPEADIRLPDGGASRAHACIERAMDGEAPNTTYRLRDLGSTNQTFVNDEPIVQVELNDGDKVRIGETIMKFVLLDEIEASFHAEVRDRIVYDQLTGLLTKESLYLAFARELDRCVGYGLPLSVLMMDLDRFKSVNDTHGHLMGSHVLSEVGAVIRNSIREEDVSARYGGEEFVSYLAEADLEGALLAAERVRAAIEAHRFTFEGKTIEVTISIGAAQAPAHGTEMTALVAAADRALYRAKESGRNRICAALESE